MPPSHRDRASSRRLATCGASTHGSARRSLRNLQLERTRMSRKAFESRLQALQARVDPRFLFDTLASIEATYEADAARGERMIDDLIAYLRAALPTIEDARRRCAPRSRSCGRGST